MSGTGFQTGPQRSDAWLEIPPTIKDESNPSDVRRSWHLRDRIQPHTFRRLRLQRSTNSRREILCRLPDMIQKPPQTKHRIAMMEIFFVKFGTLKIAAHLESSNPSKSELHPRKPKGKDPCTNSMNSSLTQLRAAQLTAA